jgi:proteasome lid subunit RPN8/RPN11
VIIYNLYWGARMIKVSPKLFNQITAYCAALLPNEACGALLGEVTADSMVIHSMLAVTNIAEQPQKQFVFDPKQLVPLMYRNQTENEQWIGIFHSHPNTDPTPSEYDLHTLWQLPTYWIISLAQHNQPIVKAFKIEENKQKKPVSYTEQAIDIMVVEPFNDDLDESITPLSY